MASRDSDFHLTFLPFLCSCLAVSPPLPSVSRSLAFALCLPGAHADSWRRATVHLSSQLESFEKGPPPSHHLRFGSPVPVRPVLRAAFFFATGRPVTRSAGLWSPLRQRITNRTPLAIPAKIVFWFPWPRPPPVCPAPRPYQHESVPNARHNPILLLLYLST